MKTEACNTDLIDDFLADRLDADGQESLEGHLDSCDACCRDLQERTADFSLWNDAKTFLSSTHDAFASALTAAEDTTAPELLRLDFLAPTDDPRMLGRFGGCEISGVIGCGGMGIVLKGFDAALNRYSAIKVLAPHYASSGAARKRFAREAQAAAAVVHDNVIAIYGVDEFNGLPYLVMPYVKGESLQKRIERDGSLSVPEILRISLQTARGLSAAHDQGLVHRDIKPGNILLPENVERVIITDFGLARAADDASLTRSGVIAGTPQYMSPEQARGEGIDARSDLFSLGSVMYTMCTGHPPFRAETPYGILRRITDNDPRPIAQQNPQIPEWLIYIIGRLLSKQPEHRFDSAEQVAELLEVCLAHVQQPEVVSLPTAAHPPTAIRRPVSGGLITAIVVGAVAVAAWTIRHTFDRQPVGASGVSHQVTNAPDLRAADTPESSDASRSFPVMERASQELPANIEVTESHLQWYPDDGIDQLQMSLNSLRQELQDPDTDTSVDERPVE